MRPQIYTFSSLSPEQPLMSWQLFRRIDERFKRDSADLTPSLTNVDLFYTLLTILTYWTRIITGDRIQLSSDSIDPTLLYIFLSIFMTPPFMTLE